MQYENTFKAIDQILWKESGCSSELDYLEQKSWLLFLKYLDDLENDCEVGYWVGKPYWNKGICTEALRLLLDYCVNTMHFENVWADYFTGNPASGIVMQKCGFHDTGKLHRCNNLVGGDKDMVHIYKLDRIKC